MAGRIQILEQPEKHNVSFEKKQWADLAKVAKAERISIHEVIRRACDAFVAGKSQKQSAS